MTSVFEHMVRETSVQKLQLLNEGKVGAYLASYRGGLAVMKLAVDRTPKKGKRGAYGIPARLMPRREVAFYRLAQLLGFESVVPETVLTTYRGKATEDLPVQASAQRYVHAMKLGEVDKRLVTTEDYEEWIVCFRETMRKFPREDLQKLTLLDVIACSRDRHANNYGVVLELTDDKARYRLIGWDNAASFGGTFRRYHNVVHKLVFRHSFDLEPYFDKLHSIRRREFEDALMVLDDHTAVQHAWLRLQFILEYPHRLPWHVLSEGHDDPDTFPTYEDYFTPVVDGIAGEPAPRFILRQSRLSG